MTTPTQLREAADGVEKYFYAHCDDSDDNPYKESFEQLISLARAIADAQSDAGRAAMDYFDSLNWHRAPDEYETAIYLAGHAQGVAAGLAAQDAKVKELEAERDMYRDACQAYYDKQIARNHKMENLPQIEKPKDIREGLLHLADWFDALYDDEKEIEVSRDLRKWADDVQALATAKADALELAKEVRRLDVYCLIERPAAVTAAMERYT